MSASSEHNPQPSQPEIDAINSGIRYAAYSVFRSASPLPADRAALVDEVTAGLADLEARGLVVRGWYDVSAFRADADVLIWWHAEQVELVQQAYQWLRRTELGRHLDPVWSNIGLHRPAEFNRAHVPAFLAGEAPRGYICVYPFVRSYEWYLLEEKERRTMLRDHGLAARPFPDVRANTISSFALGDYEWLLAFEADDLHRIVDLMRELRDTQARLHVREEVPFYTGPRVSVEDLIASLP